MHIPIWDLDESKILTRRELATVLAVVARTANPCRNRIIVRLACCCGLRVSEIAALRMDDVVIRATELAKARKAAIDEALASGDPKRVRWALKTQRGLKGKPQTEARRAEFEKLIPDLKERYAACQADSQHEPTVGVT